MQFEGEHLLPGKLGHLFVLTGFVAALVATISYYIAGNKKDIAEKISWIKFSRLAFFMQVACSVLVFGTIFIICRNHYFEYMYAFKHASLELESKYLLACIWEGQEGSFLLWAIWNGVLGIIIIYKNRDPEKSVWEAPVMSVISLAQFFLFFMILGIYIFNVRIGSSPFTLTRNELNAPIFASPNYLDFLKDGQGLNVLLRNYWMVIHPPILFLGFASTIIPFAYAYAGMQTRKWGEWIQPALPWALIGATVLGVGIMMGGKWAYESLSFGGYWAWDPVENASLVPWLILVSGLHTMVIYRATGHSLRASYVFAILGFVFVLYATFLTRTGILQDTSVHAFTLDETTKKVTYTMLLSFLGVFTLPALWMFFANKKSIPALQKEESTDSREFWMFIGALVLFFASMFIIIKTSSPVWSPLYKLFTGHDIAPPERIEVSYNKILLPATVIIATLTAIAQYFKYKGTPGGYILKKIAFPTLLAAVITVLIAVFNPITYYREGGGYLGAIYFTLFAAVYAVVANASYIWIALNGKLRSAGASIAHFGFALMLVGMLISSSNKTVISNSRVNGINWKFGKDPMTKEESDPTENLTLLKTVPTRMGPYEVTYLNDSMGHEANRKFYHLSFNRLDPSQQQILEHFDLWPDVYLMDGNMSSNPDTKIYYNKDVYTYVSAVKKDTSTFRFIEMKKGDTGYYSKGYFILRDVGMNLDSSKTKLLTGDTALVANISFQNKDSVKFAASPSILVDKNELVPVEDTLTKQDLVVRLDGVVDVDKKLVRIGIKESNQITDFVTLKAYVFPWINIVWIGLIIMAMGILLSAIRRVKLSNAYTALVLIAAGAGLTYMFLFAN